MSELQVIRPDISVKQALEFYNLAIPKMAQKDRDWTEEAKLHRSKIKAGYDTRNHALLSDTHLIYLDANVQGFLQGFPEASNLPAIAKLLKRDTNVLHIDANSADRPCKIEIKFNSNSGKGTLILDLQSPYGISLICPEIHDGDEFAFFDLFYLSKEAKSANLGPNHPILHLYQDGETGGDPTQSIVLESGDFREK